MVYLDVYNRKSKGCTLLHGSKKIPYMDHPKDTSLFVLRFPGLSRCIYIIYNYMIFMSQQVLYFSYVILTSSTVEAETSSALRLLPEKVQ